MKTAITGHISDEATTAITGLTSNVAANAGQEVKKDAQSTQAAIRNMSLLEQISHVQNQ